jgi:hypothetical protein
MLSKKENKILKKIKNIKYKIENLMQDSIKYLYQKRLNKKLGKSWKGLKTYMEIYIGKYS